MDLGNIASLTRFYPELIMASGILVIVILDLVMADKRYLGPLALITAAAS